ncbi:MAG: redoxin domain-containing protein [Waddliaceae bacterium]
MAEEGIKEGDRLPPFLIQDHEGYDVTDEDVLGTPLVISFFPSEDFHKNKEAILLFQKKIQKFDELQTLILAVSSDPVQVHQEFVKQHAPEFSLLSDVKKDMCRTFGVMKGDQVQRATFVVNARGVICWVEIPMKILGHVDRVIKAIKHYCRKDIVKFDDFGQEYKDFLKESLEISETEKEMEKKIMKEFGIKESDLE